MKPPAFNIEQLRWLEDKIFNPLVSVCMTCASIKLTHAEKEDILKRQARKLRKLMRECEVENDQR